MTYLGPIQDISEVHNLYCIYFIFICIQSILTILMGPMSCEPPSTKRRKTWPYDEYYIGQKDENDRRNGVGENHWTGAESMEWYSGHFLRNTMHGVGEYRWRYLGEKCTFATYEGWFYANDMHGYGSMSYPDGKVFTGLFHSNVRFGPGVERSLDMRCNVGFWYGDKLTRLAWCPAAPSITPDLANCPAGPSFVEQFRTILAENTKIIGETNSAIDLLKKYGADPMLAVEQWPRLYPKHCTDMNSVLCHKDVFDYDYYNGKITSIEVVANPVIDEEDDDSTKNDNDNENENENGNENSLGRSEQPQPERHHTRNYFAWNNNPLAIQMMQHCYKHESQRMNQVNLSHVLNVPQKGKKHIADNYELDCRSFLLACFMGDITNVTRLVNDSNVYADLSDAKGNTALMYAVCGDKTDVIHFLVEAGANVNGYNDNCCTPLAVAIMRYLCMTHFIVARNALKALTPPPAPKTTQQPVVTDKRKASPPTTDWIIERNEISLSTTNIQPTIGKQTSSKKFKPGPKLPPKAVKSEGPISLQNLFSKENAVSYESVIIVESVQNVNQRRFSIINEEYMIKLNTLMSANSPFSVPYLFELTDMSKEMLESDVEKGGAKHHNHKPITSKSKQVVSSKESKCTMPEMTEPNSDLKLRNDICSEIMLTILQLLSDGADPRLVTCPQPALYMAIMADSPDLVRHLLEYGADINVNYSQALNYTPLDIALSQKFSSENLEMIKVLLENGADTNHRLHYVEIDPVTMSEIELPGPTLLHVLLSKKSEFEFEEEIRHQILTALLDHYCDATVQWKGSSAIDTAMNKRLDLVDIFVKNPKVNLNAVINNKNQTILVKFFDRDYFKSTTGVDRFSILTNLLLNGADPLIESRNNDDVYGNVFAFAMKNFEDMQQSYQAATKQEDSKKSKSKQKIKAASKTKQQKEKPRLGGDDLEYQQAICLMTECARLLHIRWLQGKIMKELIEVIYKFKHRTWNMILKECKNPMSPGLWLNTQRCLEIWNVLKNPKKKLYNDEQVLKHLLCIVEFYNKRVILPIPFATPMTATEKNIIETDISCLIKEHKITSKLMKQAEALQSIRVKPELAPKCDKRFNICFECGLPLKEEEKKQKETRRESKETRRESKETRRESKETRRESKETRRESKEMRRGASKTNQGTSQASLNTNSVSRVWRDDMRESLMGTITCSVCQLVKFCGLGCMMINVDRVNCHPCSERLKLQYFLQPEDGPHLATTQSKLENLSQ